MKTADQAFKAASVVFEIGKISDCNLYLLICLKISPAIQKKIKGANIEGKLSLCNSVTVLQTNYLTL